MPKFLPAATVGDTVSIWRSLLGMFQEMDKDVNDMESIAAFNVHASTFMTKFQNHKGRGLG